MPTNPGWDAANVAGRSSVKNDFRLASLAVLLPRPTPGSRALVVDLDSDALVDAMTYLGATVTITHYDVDGLLASSDPGVRSTDDGQARPVGSNATLRDSEDNAYDLAIVDVRRWDETRIPMTDQHDRLEEIRRQLRPNGSLLTITPNAIARVWDEAREGDSRVRSATSVAAWMLRQGHTVKFLLRPWQHSVVSRSGFVPMSVFLPYPSVSDLSAIRAPGAPMATVMRQSWRRARRLTRLFLRYFGHLLTREHLVLWSANRGDTPKSPLYFELGGSRSTVIPMPTGPRVGIDSARTFVKLPLAEAEAGGIVAEVENTNQASAYFWRGYAAPWATSGDYEGVSFARFPHMDDDVVPSEAVEEALQTIFADVSSRARAERPLDETDVVHRVQSSLARGLLEGAELRRAVRAVLEAGRRPVRVMLSHGDLHRGNILISKGQFRVIDWQSAETNPVFLDPLHSANYLHRQSSARFGPLVAWASGASLGSLGQIAEHHLDGTARTTAALLAILHACSQFGADGSVPAAIAMDAEAAVRSIMRTM